MLGPLRKSVSKGKENGEVKWLWGTAGDETEAVRDQTVKMEKQGSREETSCFQELDVRFERSLVWPGIAASVLITIIVI